MRLIPKNTHPITDTNSQTEVQIWLPNDFVNANGGQFYCEIQSKDHVDQPTFHTDLIASSCSISNDQKISVKTSAI
jgi:hypothetical protein